jgi:hypothetical protein
VSGGDVAPDPSTRAPLRGANIGFADILIPCAGEVEPRRGSAGRSDQTENGAAGMRIPREMVVESGRPDGELWGRYCEQVRGRNGRACQSNSGQVGAWPDGLGCRGGRVSVEANRVAKSETRPYWTASSGNYRWAGSLGVEFWDANAFGPPRVCGDHG